MEPMSAEDRLEVAEHLKSLASGDFKIPKLKLRTEDTNKIGLIKVDGKMLTIEELKELKEVKGDLNLSGLGLTELPDLSHLRVGGDFDCSSNGLTSLKGSPQMVGGTFRCTSASSPRFKEPPRRSVEISAASSISSPPSQVHPRKWVKTSIAIAISSLHYGELLRRLVAISAARIMT